MAKLGLQSPCCHCPMLSRSDQRWEDGVGTGGLGRGRKATAVGKPGRLLAPSGPCTLWSAHLLKSSPRGFRQECPTGVSVGKGVSWGWSSSIPQFSKNFIPGVSRRNRPMSSQGTEPKASHLRAEQTDPEETPKIPASWCSEAPHWRLEGPGWLEAVSVNGFSWRHGGQHSTRVRVDSAVRLPLTS